MIGLLTESLGLPILGQVSEISKKDLFENRGVIVKTPEETQRMGARTVNTRKRKRV